MFRINHKPLTRRRQRIRPWLILWLLLPGLLPVQTPSALAQTSEPYAMPAPVRRLIFEGAEVLGNSRTSEKLVLQQLALKPGQEISQEAILQAVDRLRLSGLFDEVEFFTRPGSQRGHLVLVVEVVEKAAAPSSAGFRFGTGNTDLDGWYIIPLEFSATNLLKHGEQIDAQFRLGYRLFGFLFRYQDNNLGSGRFFWGGNLSSFNTQPVFYLNGAEAVHRVDRGALDLHLGYRIGSRWAVNFGLKLENVDARFQAEYYQDDPVRGTNKGDLIPWEDLPPQMVADSDERKRTVLRGDLVLDTKSPQLLAATPVSGFWGRLRLEGTVDSAGDFPGASLDIRHYQSLIGGVLSLRAHTAAVGNRAPFYDRLYLGGLYTVRGFPSQSLTRPEGDTWLWQGNLEFRAPLLGDPSLPRVAGSLFLDVGQSGSFDISPTASPAVGAGWGLRLRIFETIYLGLDAAVPLTDSPAAEAFHVNASLGWNF